MALDSFRLVIKPLLETLNRNDLATGHETQHDHTSHLLILESHIWALYKLSYWPESILCMSTNLSEDISDQSMQKDQAS